MRFGHVLMGMMVAAGLMGGAAEVRGQGIVSGGRVVGPRPVPPVGWTYRWVPPLYRTVAEQVWIPGRVEMVQDWVEVSPGRWEQVWRQVTVPGRWETRTRQELVREGYWELVRLAPPPVVVVPQPMGTVGVEGYRSGPGEDMSKFSPLMEWPEKK